MGGRGLKGGKERILVRYCKDPLLFQRNVALLIDMLGGFLGKLYQQSCCEESKTQTMVVFSVGHKWVFLSNW